MTRFQLSCSSWYTDSLLGYARMIRDADIPGVTVIVEQADGDPDDGDVWLEIETLDALLAVKQLLGIQLIVGGGTEDHKDYTLEIYDAWRE